MSQQRTVEERIADWWDAYQTVRDTLTPEGFRALAALGTDTENVQAINIGLAVARVVFDNDRTAAVVAESLTRYVRKEEDYIP